ncbi:MAG: ABC transporter ATP-binding protein [Nocardiopsaceae bacterium]|nr:ABC transporter ATP-binding protein [Nocardiopsaceae bacterium]
MTTAPTPDAAPPPDAAPGTPATSADGEPPALEVTGLSRRFGGLFALRDVTLSVPAGARFGIIGPNGAGKTTLFNVLSGELRPTSGTIAMNGRNITRLSPPRRAALGLGRTFQITRLFTDLTVRENLTLAIGGLSRSKLQMLRPWRSYRSQQRRAGELAASFGLGDRLDLRPAELSHGELRELEVLLALAADPAVLLLDEPAAGLSPAERVDIQELITRLPASLTVVVIEHDMNVLREVVDELAVLHLGELVTQGATEQVQRDPAVREIYLGSGDAGSGGGAGGGSAGSSGAGAKRDADAEGAGEQ